MTTAQITPDALAAKFSAVLREWLTPEQMETVRERNTTAAYADACASHDFCDANMAMHEALLTMSGEQEPDYTDEATITLVNSAWDMAKANGFKGEAA